jgi:hypothetical protein
MWKDSAGIAHFVNKEYDVPDRYKAKAKALYPEAADAGTAAPNSANAQVQADSTVQPPPVARPEVKPDAGSKNTPVTQVVTPPKAPERKSRRQRVRRADDE